jgi:hypothetical protein
VKNSTGHDIADALGPLLRRSTRARLHTQLTEGLGKAVDDLTYPVLSGLARTGACSAADLGREIGLDRTTVTRRADSLATWPQADAQAFARQLRRFVDEGPFADERH